MYVFQFTGKTQQINPLIINNVCDSLLYLLYNLLQVFFKAPEHYRTLVNHVSQQIQKEKK